MDDGGWGVLGSVRETRLASSNESVFESHTRERRLTPRTSMDAIALPRTSVRARTGKCISRASSEDRERQFMDLIVQTRLSTFQTTGLADWRLHVLLSLTL